MDQRTGLGALMSRVVGEKPARKRMRGLPGRDQRLAVAESQLGGKNGYVKHWRYIIGAVVFIAVAIWVAMQPRPAAVSVVVHGFEANAYDGRPDCVLLLTNVSREQFTVHMQAQTNGPSGWVPVEIGFHGNPNASYRPDLPAFSQRTLSFPLSPPTSRWRVVLRCYQENPANLKGIARMRRRARGLLFGTEYPEYYFTSPEMPPNQPAAGKAGSAPQLTIGHQCPGLPEPERWAQNRE